MKPFLRFLVVDDVTENRQIISRALFRQYPAALVCECSDASTAFACATQGGMTLALVHRTHDHDGISLVAFIREASQVLPVVLMSARQQIPIAAEIGADAVISWENWQGIGPVIGKLLARPIQPSVAD